MGHKAEALRQRGVTDGHQGVAMNDKRDTKRNRIHEIFHTLFYDYDGAGSGIGSYDKQDMPNDLDVSTVIDQLPNIPPPDDKSKTEKKDEK
ncbi:hypothetical protein [Mucilaginibacter sp.]|uniref:hypothetical protein n=1 Tax=Mucilaginibacter sp. TaxID=1882438 RepID=UPI0025EA724D|nr:hypothetical protein [Mucilaginibacter sp.]